jgi:hypothetical protein
VSTAAPCGRMFAEHGEGGGGQLWAAEVRPGCNGVAGGCVRAADPGAVADVSADAGDGESRSGSASRSDSLIESAGAVRTRRPELHVEEMEKFKRTVERPFGELLFSSVSEELSRRPSPCRIRGSPKREALPVEVDARRQQGVLPCRHPSRAFPIEPPPSH